MDDVEPVTDKNNENGKNVRLQCCFTRAKRARQVKENALVRFLMTTV